MLKSLCYQCAHYDWAIVVPTEMHAFEWEHICKAGLLADDFISACSMFNTVPVASFALGSVKKLKGKNHGGTD